MRNDKENVIVDKSLQFAVEIIRFSEKLEEEKKFVIARQVLKSGTSIGANVREAQNAESKADFIHKLKIAAKEVEETDYWLLLCKLSVFYPYDELLHQNLVELAKILSKNNQYFKTVIWYLENDNSFN
jgi:four helix bundle protein